MLRRKDWNFFFLFRELQTIHLPYQLHHLHISFTKKDIKYVELWFCIVQFKGL